MSNNGFHWQFAPLREVAEITYGLTVNRERREAKKRAPYLTVANVRGERIDFSNLKEIGVLPGDNERYVLRTGDVLVIEGHADPKRLGRAALWRGELLQILHQNHLIRVRPKSEAVSKEWVFRAINSPAAREQIEREAKTSSGLNTINSRVIGDLRIPLPPLPEQHKIAAILSSVDDTIEKTQAVIDQLQVVKKAMMQELLTRGIPGRHTRFKQTEIGEVPEGWEVTKLSDCADVIDPNPSHRYPPDEPGGIPLISTSDFVGDDDYTYRQCQHVSRSAFIEQDNRCRFEPNDVVFARKGRIGFARAYGEQRKTFSHTVVTMKARCERLDPRFLLWIVRSNGFIELLQRFMNSNSGVPTLGVRIIGSTLVPVPSLEEQGRISTTLQLLGTRIAAETRALDGLQKSKNALMSVLLTGELRVTPDDPAPRPPPPAQATLGRPQPDGGQPP